MKPKEIAKELAEKYFEQLFEYIPNIANRMVAAKQCALIYVDGMIKEYEEMPVPISPTLEFFWRDVKTELEAL